MVSYNTANYEEQGGAVMVIGGELRIASGGSITAAGTQATVLADVAITWSSNGPSITPNNAVTIADGDTPTVVELQELCVEINAKVSAIIDALQGAGIVATA